MNNAKSLTSLGHLFLALCLVVISSTANAQTTPAHSGSDNSSMTQPPQQGWMWWDDASFKKMNIDESGTTKLRAIDDRYRAEYDKLGKTPWTNEGYKALTERRNSDIKGVLTPEQYQHWSTPATSRKPSTGTTPTTTPTPAK